MKDFACYDNHIDSHRSSKLKTFETRQCTVPMLHLQSQSTKKKKARQDNHIDSHRTSQKKLCTKIGAFPINTETHSS